MPQYWMTMTNPTNFEIDRKADFSFTGYKERIRKTCNRVKVGDRLVYYITKMHRFGATCTIKSTLYTDNKPHWSETDEIWPCRFNMKPDIVLAEEHMLDVEPLVPSLSFISAKQKEKGWGTAFMGSLRLIPQADFELIESKMKELSTGKKISAGSQHDQMKEMLYEIGKMEGRVSEKEYRIDGEKIDVAWKKIATGNPQSVFEVQIGGNFYEALAKLKHAWDIWNSRPYLVTTEQYKGKALQWLKGSFHEIEAEVTIIDCDRVRELYDAVKKAKEIKNEFGIK